MLRLVVLGLAALASASPLLHGELSLTGDLLQGNFAIGSAPSSGFFSTSDDLALQNLLVSFLI